MWKGIFIIAFKTLWKRKFYSIINILGLSIGMASLIYISLYILDELSYDKYHQKHERIFRVCRLFYTPGYVENAATCSFPLAPSMKEEYPELIEQAVRFFNFQVPSIYLEYKLNDSTKLGFNESRLYFVDTCIFSVFTFNLLHGNVNNVFAKENALLITESAAKRYFKDDMPVGKKLWLEDKLEFEVTGVMEDLPDQSHLKIDLLASIESVKNMYGGKLPETWIWNPCWTYILLKDTVSHDLLQENFPAFYKDHYFDFRDEDIKLYLQPLDDIHLKSHIDYEMSQNGFISHIYILSAVGLFVIIIAVINFINLTTAISAGRAREVGIKKVTGVLKKQLVLQFLTESVFMTIIALAFALLLVEALFPHFNSFSDKDISFKLLLTPGFISIIFILSFLLGILSGFYPSFYISRFSPVEVLKGRLAQGVRSGLTRKILVTVQYAISIALVISTIIIIMQVNYLHKANLGFIKEEIIIMPSNNKVLKKFDEFKAEILTDTSIIALTGMDDILGVSHNTWGFKVTDREDKMLFYPALMVRDDFIKTFGLQLVEGVNFVNKNIEQNVNAIILNESMVHSLGWTNKNTIGRHVECGGNGVVVGVVKDFNALSLHKPAGDFVLCKMSHPGLAANFTRHIAIRLKMQYVDHALQTIQDKWAKYTEGRPFDYSYLNKNIAQLYTNEGKFQVFTIILTIITIFLANLGTFALTSFLTEKRTKEIGMRKVLGASITKILKLFSKEIALLILLSSLLGWPLAYFISQKWLNNFAYTISISWWIYLVAVIFSLFLAILIVWLQAYRAAVRDPVKTLRYE